MDTGALSQINYTASIFSRSNPNRRFLSTSKSTLTFASYRTSINADINTHLKNAIPIRPPLEVFEPMHNLTFAAPENSAPALCIAACELVGGQRDQALAAASALWLMHAAAFTHENIPLTEEPAMSSGPVFHHAYEPNIELLIADGMIPFGFEILTRLNNPSEDDWARVLRVIIEIARAVGSQGVVEGQYNEIEYSKSNGDESFYEKWLDHVGKKKEGELHACGAACGAILGGGSEDEVEKLRRFGGYVGMIQGIYKREEKSKWLEEKVKELRNLALKELEDFNEGKSKKIWSLVEN